MVFLKGKENRVKLRCSEQFKKPNSASQKGFQIMWRTSLDRFIKRDYYHIRIRQEDGEIAWSSPIWGGE